MTKVQTPRAPRTQVLLEATLTNRFSTQKVRIRDFTHSGARLAGKSPGVGSIVKLIRDGQSIDAKVMWERPGSFGIKFHCSLDDAAIFRPKATKIDLPIHAHALTRAVPTPAGRPSVTQHNRQDPSRRFGRGIGR